MVGVVFAGSGKESSTEQIPSNHCYGLLKITIALKFVSSGNTLPFKKGIVQHRLQLGEVSGVLVTRVSGYHQNLYMQERTT